jgi:hypothetical protein
LTQINTAIATLQATSNTIGSNNTILQTRSDFIKSMIDTLNGGAAILTANDSNADSAMVLALQARQQLAATALSISTNSAASALRLFS